MGYELTYPLIDLRDFSKFEDIRTSLNDLAALIEDDTGIVREISLIPKDSFGTTYTSPFEPRALNFSGAYTFLRDLGDLMDYIEPLSEGNANESQIKARTSEIKDYLKSIIIRSYSEEKGISDVSTGSPYGLTVVTRLMNSFTTLYLAGYDEDKAYDYSNWSWFSSDNGKWAQLVTRITNN